MEQTLLSPREIKRYEMVQARLKEGHKIEKILLDYGVSRRIFEIFGTSADSNNENKGKGNDIYTKGSGVYSKTTRWKEC